MDPLLLWAIGLFLFWSCIGSFCGVLLESSASARSFWTGRSQCTNCRRALRWFELLPVISYLLQRGKCRHCHAAIPAWVFHIEFLMGVVWVLFWTIFFLQGFDPAAMFAHLAILSMILVLAIEDMKSGTIPDRLSFPMIFLTVLLVWVAGQFSAAWLLPSLREAFAGAFLGMLFYLLQMIIPALTTVLRKKRYSVVLQVIATPVFFPFWMVSKFLFGEKRADRWIPSIETMDRLPTWVGGGDVRLGILLGLVVGPVYLWWVIGIGYTLGTLFWMAAWLTGKRDLETLPVAPLVFGGFCATWMILIFA